VVWADGKLNVERGAGRYIEKPPFASYYDAMRKTAERNVPQPVRRRVPGDRVRQSR
jgi:dihydropyrimidinase